ncbi:hypothetical protein MKZ38_005918 [Zalerion maritima]|uniref:Uncharacterized protein n=1 Tax=Zalerion maritima TaxID=339359 RepID=A0AAD5WNZ6_9PEZI|nr:hypothetical protein MKZ38_005918 [Zalerion maritima]
MSHTYSHIPNHQQQYQYGGVEDPVQEVPQPSYSQPQYSYPSAAYSQDGTVIQQAHSRHQQPAPTHPAQGYGFGGYEYQQQQQYQPVQQQVQHFQSDPIPAHYANQPGEYDSQYRPDVQAYHARHSSTYMGIDSQDGAAPVELGEPQVPASVPYANDGRVPNYKPAPLRWWFMGLIILALGGLLAGLAYATYVLPESDEHRLAIPDENSDSDGNSKRGLVMERQEAGTTTVIATTPTTSHEGAGQRPTEDYAQETVSTPAVVTESRPPDDYAKETVSSPVTTPPSNTPTPDYSRPPSDYGKETVTSTRPPSDYADGRVTSTPPVLGAPPESDYGDETVTITHSDIPDDFLGTTTVSGHVITRTADWVTAEVTTITSDGVVITSTSTPKPFSTPTTLVSTDATGHVVTLTSSVLASASLSTAYDSNGVPTQTMTFHQAIPTDKATSEATVSILPKGHNFIGTFLPTLATALLTIVVRMVDLQAKLYTPWHRLTYSIGSSTKESLCLRTSGWHSIIASMRAVIGGEFLVFLSTVLLACSALLVPLSAESVALKLEGTCTRLSFSGCTLKLAVFPIPAKAALGLMGFMLLVATLLMIVLTRWRTGVAANPWSIAGVASLSTNQEVRQLLVNSLPNGNRAISHGRLLRALRERHFRLAWFYGKHSSPEYGIVLHDQSCSSLSDRSSTKDGGKKYSDADDVNQDSAMAEKELLGTHNTWEIERNLPFSMLTPWGRAVFLLFLTGVEVVILYYNNTGGDTAFEIFMDDQGFGVRFLWTALGVITTFFWSSYFHSVATLSPYTLMSSSATSGGQPASKSILLHPPSNPFSGLFRAIHRGQPYLILVSFTAILSEFMPLILNQIPYRPTQTLQVHRVTYIVSVTVLSFMILVILLSFWPKMVRWPHMPLDPSTIAGAMFMVADSWMMWGFEGMGAMGNMDEKERDERIKARGERYEYGEIVGNAGTVGGMRVGVDCVDAGGDNRI